MVIELCKAEILKRRFLELQERIVDRALARSDRLQQLPDFQLLHAYLPFRSRRTISK